MCLIWKILNTITRKIGTFVNWLRYTFVVVSTRNYCVISPRDNSCGVAVTALGSNKWFLAFKSVYTSIGNQQGNQTLQPSSRVTSPQVYTDPSNMKKRR